MSRFDTIGRSVTMLIALVLAAAVAVGLLWGVPEYTDLGLLQVILVGAIVGAGGLVGSRVAANLFPGYNVAEVEVDDVITRSGDAGPLPMGGQGVSADEIVDQIERADADDNAEGLIVKLNTPGGQVVPSDDIRRAVAEFDGPTIAYAEDMAASGGYWIASGADEIHARRGAIVGSIGVNGVQLGRTDLREMLGLEYRRFVAGEYKDTPSVWRDLEEDEVEYFQNLLDGYYEQFVDTVTDGTELSDEFVRETEARIYLGDDANEMGLVDTCGPRADMEDRLADRIGVEEVTVEAFEPERGLTERVSIGARSIAHAFGSGVASVLVSDDEVPVRV